MEVTGMISENLQEMLNNQINKEFYSAYLYLSIEAYLTSINLPGFANWFHVQTQEERDHALIFFNYINRVGGRVVLKNIDGPKVDFASIEEALKLTLEHERFVTKSIYEIVDAALAERDHKTNTFLQWFIDEQVEEEDNADKNIKKFSLVKDDGKGILMMDADMAARVYVQAAPLMAQQA
jgi:ferritin